MCENKIMPCEAVLGEQYTNHRGGVFTCILEDTNAHPAVFVDDSRNVFALRAKIWLTAPADRDVDAIAADINAGVNPHLDAADDQVRILFSAWGVVPSPENKNHETLVEFAQDILDRSSDDLLDADRDLLEQFIEM